MDARQERLARNEALFRSVNERVGEINAGFNAIAGDGEFICECADTGCVDRISMSLDDYERVRAEPTHFLIKPGHAMEEIEEVVEHHREFVVVAKRYDVVEAREGGPAGIAEQTGPRS